MKRCVLQVVLFAIMIVLCCTHVAAEDTVPGDLDGNRTVSETELCTAILTYLDGSSEHLLPAELRAASRIHAYYPRTIVCADGMTVTTYKPIERIIALSDPQADAVRVLGAEDRVTGVSSGIAAETMLLPVMCRKPVVGTSAKPDPEAILALKPDIVITYGTWNIGLEDKIEPDVRVVRLDFTDPDNLTEDMRKLGYLLEEEARAEEFIEWHNSYMSVIKNRTELIPNTDKPKVYMELYPNIWRYKTFSKNSSGDRQCTIAGGINIASDLFEGSPTLDPEWVLEQNPDVIIQVVTSKLPSGYDCDDPAGMKRMRDELTSRPELADVSAVENERVHVVASDIRCGVQQVVSIAYFAKWFHPDIFEDMDPQTIRQEYLERFQRIDFNVSEHRVFVYPEMKR
ncbi:MAG: ABC transporter substrate-binding protein [Euryarchaeota archaeon]|nr:ABC transporter substrate-binding protein [Euryarchaeota archaeon]